MQKTKEMEILVKKITAERRLQQMITKKTKKTKIW